MRWGAAAEATQSSSGERDRGRERGREACCAPLGWRRGGVGGRRLGTLTLTQPHPRPPTLTSWDEDELVARVGALAASTERAATTPRLLLFTGHCRWGGLPQD
jgi:hypothetical protein